MQALESQTTHTAPSTADLHLSHPCSTFCHASKPAPIAPIMPFERVAAHGTLELPDASHIHSRSTAVTPPAPPLHPLQPWQTTCHGAARSTMTSCSRRGSSLHQSSHPHHICISSTAARHVKHGGKWQGTCVIWFFPIQYDFSAGHGAYCLFRRTRGCA